MWICKKERVTTWSNWARVAEIFDQHWYQLSNGRAEPRHYRVKTTFIRIASGITLMCRNDRPLERVDALLELAYIEIKNYSQI